MTNNDSNDDEVHIDTEMVEVEDMDQGGNNTNDPTSTTENNPTISKLRNALKKLHTSCNPTLGTENDDEDESNEIELSELALLKQLFGTRKF